MSEIAHKNLAAGKWNDLTILEQLGNIGSEVGRAIAWQKKGNNEYKEKALERAFELMDLTVNDERWVVCLNRNRELLRVREVLADFFYGDNIYQSLPKDLEKYFYYFALAARRNR